MPMTPNLTLIIVAGVLITAGVYLLLERSLTRILVGVLLAGNGVNLLFLVASGAAGGAPIIDTERGRDISDPLPQAMVLTAIVITLGMTAFLLTLAYRSFQLNGHDEVADDVEDRQILQLAEADLASASYDEDDPSLPSEDDRIPTRPRKARRSRAGQSEPSGNPESADSDERRDAAEEATDEIIGRGEGGTGS